MNHAKDALPEIRAWWKKRRIDFDFDRALVAVFRVGSHSHGTHVPPEDPEGIDDTDYMVILCPPPASVLGLRRFEDWVLQEDGLDVVFYEWGKYVRLLIKSNPNAIGTLWLHEEDWWTPPQREGADHGTQTAFELLRFHRNGFLSKSLLTAFHGYARAQLHKMTHHALQGYMGDKRKRLVERFGYDVKNASHLIRLMRMACECIETGTLKVRRDEDVAELIDIKRGRWSLERVGQEAQRLFERASAAEAASDWADKVDSTLPEAIMLRGYMETWDFTRRVATP